MTTAVASVHHLEHLEAYGYFFWIANGILLAYLLLAPRWRWPWYLAAGLGGLTLGSILTGETWHQYALVNCLNLLEVLIAALLLRKRSDMLLRLTERGQVVRFLAFGAVLGPAVSAILMGLYSTYQHHAWAIGLGTTLSWLTRDGLGIAISTPAFLAILSLRVRHLTLRKNWTPAVLYLLLTWVSFSQNWFPTQYFLYPLLILVLVRLGLGIALLALLISSALSIYMTLAGAGPTAHLASINPMMPTLMLESGVAAGIVLIYTVSVLVESRTKAEHKLQDTATLHNLLMENCRDGIVITNDETSQRYMSPAVYSLTGYSREDLDQRSLLNLIHPEDFPQIMRIFAELRTGRESALLEWRIKKHDGQYIWLEGNLCPIRNQRNGLVEGILSFSRDITDRKLVEQRLQAAYQVVETLSVTDALTGISNRRRFDQVLPTEWRRALRDQAPLTMLMLDVDLFKLYNDTYGHLRGDNCLREIAESILEVVFRAEDLVARYGGEEFAVLLPNTPREGGLRVAEKICEALALRHMEHRESPFGLVTVSIGSATLVPMLGQEPLQLVDLSDKTLYEAKGQGRNCILSAG
jgi:diguanylate cyclase (GGDEF)-like protein/PAS domain S-box-containing protein